MTDTLQTYQLPNSHLPGSTLLSRYICKQPSVMGTILSSIFDDEPPSDYYCGDTCLANGSRCDVLYQSPTNLPVMVQIQKNVTASWLRTTVARCCFVLDNENNLPSLVIFSVEPLPSNVAAMCCVSQSAPYAYNLDMPLFAQQIQILCPTLVSQYLESTDLLEAPLIVLLSSFFSLQHPAALTSATFSKHPFYDELYRHAVRFCQHLAIELEPIQYNAPTSTADTAHTSSSVVSQHQLAWSLLGEIQPYSLRQTRLRSNTTAQRSASVPYSYLPSTTRRSTPAARSSPSSTLRINKDKNRLQIREAMHRNNTNHGKNVHLAITSVDQHDMDVIRDFCQEKFDLGKTWQAIYDEGYGKYFAYKNRDSLKRSIRRHLKVGIPRTTTIDQHDTE